MADQMPDFGKVLSAFNSEAFSSLRPGQRLVLDEYARGHLNNADLAIEMATGTGKTLVALLIADRALERGWSVAYLTGTRQLAEDVEREAAHLGLAAVRFSAGDYGGAKLDDYHQAQTVGVMNYWVYFNSSPVPEPADLVIFDDAHLAEQALSGLHTLRIPAKAGPGRDLYGALIELVRARTDTYAGLPAMHEGTAMPGTPPELLSFVDWTALAPQARVAIENSEFAKTEDARHIWPVVREHLTQCGVLIGNAAIEIRPYHPPTVLNQQYHKAKQRLYISATLGSMDDLQRRIGSHLIAQLVPDEPLPANETGTRKLVLNPTPEQAFEPTILDWAIPQAQRAGRTAWLCSSLAEADILEATLRERGMDVHRLRRGGDESAVVTWLESSTGQLVTAGRYDGFDLAGEACRLVILPTVPQGSSEFERFVVAYLGDAKYMRHRVGQRVTQALGRANRHTDDRALYLGLDPAFAQILAESSVRRSMPPEVQAIVREALELYDEGSEATVRAIEKFWEADNDQQTAPAVTSNQPARPRPGRASARTRAVSTADDEVRASTALWSGDYQAAVDNAQSASASLADSGELEHSAFWRYVEAHALYDRGRPGDHAAAKEVLADVVSNGPRTAWFRRLSQTVCELQGEAAKSSDSIENDRIFLAWDEWRREAGSRLEHQLALGRSLLAGSHDQQCDGLRYLARLVGVHGKRPPPSEQAATDCRWAWSTSKHAELRVWEVKTAKAESPSPLSRTDVNQLLGQIQVEKIRSPNSRVFGCLLTPTSCAKQEAAEAARDQITLLNHRGALRLYELLSDRLRRYDHRCGGGTACERGAARTEVEALMPRARWLSKLLSPSAGDFVTADEISRYFVHQ